MGVRDSKLLSPSQRERLYGGILRIAKKHKAIVISPKHVDDAVLGHNLNWLEADATIEIIDALKPDFVVLDCPSNNLKAYRRYVEKKIKHKAEIRTEHKADLHFPVVSASSILAKVTRDAEVEKIKKRFNVDFGSGYPSDPRTVEFLRKNFRKHEYEGIIRKSWASVKNLEAEEKQKSLGEF